MKLFDDQLIILTGGAGFIGSGVLRHLNDRGLKNIVVVDELGTDDKWKNLVGKQFIEILDKSVLFEWLQGRESEIEAFIHLGACSATTETDASFLLENNYRYSVKLAEYALKYGHRFIYASSAATYGDGSHGFEDDHERLEELMPLNMYGYSKHLFDLWVKNQGLLNDLVGLKYFNVFGPNEWHKGRMASLLYHAFPVAHKGDSVRLFKSSDPSRFPDGGQQRDFIYVKDAVKMTCAFLENDVGGIFNIGRGCTGTWNELASSLYLALQSQPKIEYIDMPQDLMGKYQNYTCADMHKTRNVLKQAAECQTIQESVFDYVNEHLLTSKRW